jgi:hypothetical protein
LASEDDNDGIAVLMGDEEELDEDGAEEADPSMQVLIVALG